MSLLLGLLPSSLSRWLVGLLAAAALLGYVFHRGVEFEHDKMQLTIDAIQHAGDKQSLANAQKTVQHQEDLAHVVQEFHSNISALSDYWVRKQASVRPSGVPQVPTAPAGATGGQPSAVPTGPSQEEFDALERAAALTAEMFNTCRDGWISQEK